MAKQLPIRSESSGPALDYRPRASDSRWSIDFGSPLYPLACSVSFAVFGLAMHQAGRRRTAEWVVIGLPLASIWYVLARLNRDPRVPRGWLPLLRVTAIATIVSAAYAAAGLQQQIAWWRVYDDWPNPPIALIVSLAAYCAVRFWAWMEYRSMRRRNAILLDRYTDPLY
jgi:hypothetical protein